MTTGKYELVIKWPSGQGTLCGEMTDHQHGEICRILSPDYHAQPSQVGEAVAWQASFIESGGAWDAWQTCSKEHHDLVKRCPNEWPGYAVRSLYTRPADQVAEGVVVSRELLEDLRDCANECYNHARLRGTSGLDSYERLTEQADALLASKKGVKS